MSPGRCPSLTIFGQLYLCTLSRKAISLTKNLGGSMLGEISKVPAACIRFLGVISVLFLISTAFAQNGPTIPVNCDKGQSLNRTLPNLNRKMPTTILVQGTCTEYVRIDGFE